MNPWLSSSNHQCTHIFFLFDDAATNSTMRVYLMTAGIMWIYLVESEFIRIEFREVVKDQAVTVTPIKL